MKSITLIIIITFLALASCKTNRPTKNNGINDVGNKSTVAKEQIKIVDSLAYVKSILEVKEKYSQKELRILLNDLIIPVKSYISLFDNRIESSGIIISFDDWTTTNNKTSRVRGAKDPIRILVQWEKPVIRAEVESHLKQAAGEWSTAEQEFYSKLIVKDIK